MHLAYLVKEMAYLPSLFHPSRSAKYKISSFQKANSKRKSKPEHWRAKKNLPPFKKNFLKACVSVSSLSLSSWPWAGLSVWLAVSLISVDARNFGFQLSLLGLLLNSSQQQTRESPICYPRNNDRLRDQIRKYDRDQLHCQKIPAQGQLATSEMKLHGCVIGNQFNKRL